MKKNFFAIVLVWASLFPMKSLLAKVPFNEVVGVQNAEYNPENKNIKLKIMHGWGCGTYFNYKYKVLDQNISERFARLDVILETDNACEGFISREIEMQLPPLSFHPKQLVFKDATLKDVVLNIP